MPEIRYGVLGSGRQGTAAAYDLLVRGEAGAVVMADIDGGRAEAAAERLRRLTGSDRVSVAVVSASDRAALVDFLEPLDAFVSSASWRFNRTASEAALEAGTPMCDLGGNLEGVRQQL